jgi:hypothetical protein
MYSYTLSLAGALGKTSGRDHRDRRCGTTLRSHDHDKRSNSHCPVSPKALDNPGVGAPVQDAALPSCACLLPSATVIAADRMPRWNWAGERPSASAISDEKQRRGKAAPWSSAISVISGRAEGSLGTGTNLRQRSKIARPGSIQELRLVARDRSRLINLYKDDRHYI